jgi:hypothetical protein
LLFLLVSVLFLQGFFSLAVLHFFFIVFDLLVVVVLAGRLLLPKRVLAAVRDVEKAIRILLLFVNVGHQRSGWRKHVVDEDENRLFRTQLDALSDHVHELANRQIRWHQVLLLVNVWDVTAVRFLTDHWNSVWVLGSDALRFDLTLLEWVFLLE